MNNVIKHDDQCLTFTIRRSVRSRHVRLAVARDGAVTVTMPFGFRDRVAEKFVRQKRDWLRSKIAFFRRSQTAPPIFHTRPEYLKEKERARGVITTIVERYSRAYGFRYNAITIRNQKTCWGSCSRRGNLNFNYRMLYLPEATREYIIVHELGHLREFNHSKKFWARVARIMPDYRERKKGLRQFRLR